MERIIFEDDNWGDHSLVNSGLLEWVKDKQLKYYLLHDDLVSCLSEMSFKAWDILDDHMGEQCLETYDTYLGFSDGTVHFDLDHDSDYVYDEDYLVRYVLFSYADGKNEASIELIKLPPYIL